MKQRQDEHGRERKNKAGQPHTVDFAGRGDVYAAPDCNAALRADHRRIMQLFSAILTIHPKSSLRQKALHSEP